MLILFLAFGHFLKAQSSLPLTVGYWGELGIRSGIKVGTEINLHEWSKEGKNRNKQRTVYLAPQLGYYNWRRNYANLYLGADAGLKLQGEDRKFYQGVALGLGYLGWSQVMTINISLADGTVTSMDREWRNHALVTLNYFLGQDINETWGWYFKASYGPRLSTTRETSGMLFFELGVKLHLFN